MRIFKIYAYIRFNKSDSDEDIMTTLLAFTRTIDTPHEVVLAALQVISPTDFIQLIN